MLVAKLLRSHTGKETSSLPYPSWFFSSLTWQEPPKRNLLQINQSWPVISIYFILKQVGHKTLSLAHSATHKLQILV